MGNALTGLARLRRFRVLESGTCGGGLHARGGGDSAPDWCELLLVGAVAAKALVTLLEQILRRYRRQPVELL